MCSLDVSLVIETVLNAVIAISAAAAALYGIKGINTWRRELKGKSEYEIAKSALKAAYRIRDGLDHVRGDAILLHEYPAEMRTHRGDIAPENRHEALVSVYAKRFEYLQEYFLKLE